MNAKRMAGAWRALFLVALAVSVLVLAPVANAQETPTLAPAHRSGAIETDVRQIVTLSDVNVRSGPGIGYRELGVLRSGEVAKVTGLSRDRQWWQISCTQGRRNLCWVRAHAELTQPVPEYVMAVTDVNIRRGPDTDYRAIGILYAGQRAKVTGFDGSWWRIACGDGYAHNCWITAKGQYTQAVYPGR